MNESENPNADEHERIIMEAKQRHGAQVVQAITDADVVFAHIGGGPFTIMEALGQLVYGRKALNEMLATRSTRLVKLLLVSVGDEGRWAVEDTVAAIKGEE